MHKLLFKQIPITQHTATIIRLKIKRNFRTTKLHFHYQTTTVENVNVHRLAAQIYQLIEKNI